MSSRPTGPPQGKLSRPGSGSALDAVGDAVDVGDADPPWKRLQREDERAVAATHLQILDAEGPGPGIVPEPSRQLARNRLAGGIAHRMVAVRMKLDSLEDCSCR